MSLIGSVVERSPATGNTSQTPFPVSADPKTGFPAATHRSQRQRKSAFRQNMEAARPTPPRDAPIPVVQPVAGGSDAGWVSIMESENARKVANMSSQEREDELQTIQSRFGDMAELAEVLKRAKDLRSRAENNRPTSPTIEEVSDEDAKTPSRALALSSPTTPAPIPTHRVATPARPILSRRSSVSGPGGSRAGTPGVRFADVTPKDVFTYPSAPPSPKPTALMIEAPPAEGSGDDVTKVQWKGKVPALESKLEPEESQIETRPAIESISKNEDEEMPVLVLASTPDVVSEPEPELASEPEAMPEPKAHPLSQVVSVSPPATPPKRSPSPPELKLTLPTPTSSTFPSSAQIAFPTLSPAPVSPPPISDLFDPATARLSIASQLSTDSGASGYTTGSDASMPKLSQFANASQLSLNPPGSPISIDLEPSTPEALRLQYFPDEPEAKDIPALQWMMDAVDLPEIPDSDAVSIQEDENQDVEMKEDAEMKEEEDTTPTRDTFSEPKTVDPDLASSIDTEKGLAPVSNPEKEALRLHFEGQDVLRSQSSEKDALRLDEKDAPRFNLAGTPIPYDKAKDLPVHDGLHHNSRTSAGKSRRNRWAVWMCQVGVGAVCVGVMAAVSWKAAV